MGEVHRAGHMPRLIRWKCTEPRLHAGALLLSVRSYCFAAQVLVVASHSPPALSQSASVLAMVTSPAKAADAFQEGDRCLSVKKGVGGLAVGFLGSRELAAQSV